MSRFLCLLALFSTLSLAKTLDVRATIKDQTLHLQWQLPKDVRLKPDALSVTINDQSIQVNDIHTLPLPHQVTPPYHIRLRFHACKQNVCLPPIQKEMVWDPSHLSAWLFMTFFLSGLLMALSPCMLPMLPILLSMLTRDHPSQRTRPLITYMLGLIVGFGLLGVFIQGLGIYLQAWLQSPWILIPMAILLTLLALPLLEWTRWQIQYPAWFSWRPKRMSVFMSGLVGLSTPLVLSPCTAPPLLASMTYFATATPLMSVLGFLAISLGLLMPILLLGFFGIKIQMGAWIKPLGPILGLCTLAFALYLPSRLIDAQSLYFYHGIMAILLILATLKTPIHRILKGLIGLFLLSFLCYTWMQRPILEDTALIHHSQHPRMVLITASWCAACQKMKEKILKQPAFIEASSRWDHETIDMSHFESKHQAILKHFHLSGPPALLLYHAHDREPFQILKPPLSLPSVLQILRKNDL